MKPVYLVAKLASDIRYDENFDYIGIDAGAMHCFNHNIPMVCAVGDFDSISKNEKEELSKSTKLIELPCRKNETDTEIALMQARNLGYTDITLLGGLGGRQDHQFANMRLMMNQNPTFKIEDESNIMEVLAEGTHILTKKKKYFSVFALEKSCITTKDVAYELTNREIDTSDLYTVSNEILKDCASLVIHYGKVLLIHSDDVQ